MYSGHSRSRTSWTRKTRRDWPNIPHKAPEPALCSWLHSNSGKKTRNLFPLNVPVVIRVDSSLERRRGCAPSFPGPSEHIIIQATHSYYTITANRLQLRHTQCKHTSTALRNDLLALSVTVSNVFNLSLWSRLELYGNLQLSSQIWFRDFRCSVVACILFVVVHFQSICFSICTTNGIFGLNYKELWRYFGLWKSHVYSSRRFDMTICKL